MKFNLPLKSPSSASSSRARGGSFNAAPVPQPGSALLQGEFYRSPEESARRKKALVTQMEERRLRAKAALQARSQAGRPGIKIRT